jgi:hypothetical protein
MPELRQLYGGRKPKSYPPAHNHIIHTPDFPHGMNGFRRFWIPPEWVGQGWSKCPCGWRGHDPKWQVHYARSDHVGWWKEEIRKRGSQMLCTAMSFGDYGGPAHGGGPVLRSSDA